MLVSRRFGDLVTEQVSEQRFVDLPFAFLGNVFEVEANLEGKNVVRPDSA